MGMANLLVRRLESPQADQPPTNRSFRDLILSGRCFALLKRAGLFGARPAARVAWPEWTAARRRAQAGARGGRSRRRINLLPALARVSRASGRGERPCKSGDPGRAPRRLGPRGADPARA